MNKLQRLLFILISIFLINGCSNDVDINASYQQIIVVYGKYIKDHFRAKLRVAPTIQFESKESINQVKFPELKRKPVVFIDKRVRK